MNAEQHRIARLRVWLEEFDGKISGFCRHYNLPRTRASYLSQLLSGSRPLGERAARKLEAECLRPTGWLDMGGGEPQQLTYDIARFSQLPPADKELIEGFIEFVLQRHERRAIQPEQPTAFMDITEEIVPPARQMRSMRAASRKPTNGHDIQARQGSSRKRKAA